MTVISHDVVAPTSLLFKALRCSAVELARICDVVTFDILCMPIMLHDVTILVTIFPLVYSLVIQRERSIIVPLVGNHIVMRSLSSSIAWWHLGFCPQSHLDIPGIVTCPGTLLIVRVAELLYHRIKTVLDCILVRSIE
jgi:hypothetical protein